MAATKKCPYFDCKKRDFGDTTSESPPAPAATPIAVAAPRGAPPPLAPGQLSDHVYRCPSCARLSLLCENPKCLALNRPFMIHCRNCQDIIPTAEVGHGTCAEFWDRTRRSGLVDFSNAVDPDAPGAVLVNLTDEFPYRPRAKVALQFIDGLLAVHQAGGLALLHPFGNLRDGEGPSATLVFKKVEPFRVPFDCCPFPPLRLPDYRHIVFSQPRAVYAVNVWSLPGWASEQGAERFHTLIDCSHEGHVVLACPPVAWDALPHEPDVGRLPDIGQSYPTLPKLGVITRDQSGTYYWGVFDVANLVRNRIVVQDVIQQSVPLPVTGACCRIETVGNKVLALATPHGHWVWGLTGEAARDVMGLRRLLPRDGRPLALVMHRHDEDCREFHALRQYIHIHYDRTQPWPSQFSWYYLEEHGATKTLKCDTVDCESLDFLANPTEIQNAGGVAIPLGPFADNPDRPDDATEMLFACGTKLRRDVGLGLRDVPRHGPIEHLDHAAGVVFHDPVLAMMTDLNTLLVRSLTYPNASLTVSFAEIMSDPLIWSRWLFTVDDAGDGLLAVRRRDLQSPRKSRAPNA